MQMCNHLENNFFLGGEMNSTPAPLWLSLDVRGIYTKCTQLTLQVRMSQKYMGIYLLANTATNFLRNKFLSAANIKWVFLFCYKQTLLSVSQTQSVF